jgi:hypothetical protein
MRLPLLGILALLATSGCIPGVCTRVSAMRGSVVDRTGKPVEGATVSAVKVPGESGDDFHYSAKTGPLGRFQIGPERHLAFFWLIGAPPDDHWQPRGTLQASYRGASSAPLEFGKAAMGNCRLLGLGPDDPIDVGSLVLSSSASR